MVSPLQTDGTVGYYAMRPDPFASLGYPVVVPNQPIVKQSHEESPVNEEVANQEDLAEKWFDSGVQNGRQGDFLGSIQDFEKAIEIKPDYHQAWHWRGISLSALGRKEEAIMSYEKAIEIKPDDDAAWYNRGNSLSALGRKEEAIASYEKAIEIKPDYHEAWSNRGVSLSALGRNEEAIASYEKAIEIKPDDHAAWSNRGVLLSALGRYEEAIVSCDKAIEFKPDLYQAWVNRSLAAANFRSQSLYSLPIVLNQRTAQLHLKHPELTQRGYKGQFASLTIGFLYCPGNTHPLGHGFLQRSLGDAHRDHAKLQQSPRPYWRSALTAYKASLRCLTAIDHPAERLLTLQALIRTHLALNEIPQARDYQLEAIPLYSQLRDTARDKRQFELQHLSISRTEIDLLIGENNPTQALAQAEFYKNRALTWILDDWRKDPPSPLGKGGPDNAGDFGSSDRGSEVPLTTGDLGGSILTPDTAILYWHLSDDALTTFILTHDNPTPIVLECDR